VTDTVTGSAALVERRGNVMVITINRPEARNAINAAVSIGVGDAIEEAQKDPEVRAVVLTGAGDKSFCAGVDLKALAKGENVMHPEHPKWGFAGYVRHFIDKPTIAAVNGTALGGGTELALASDLVVAGESATFGLPEVRVGVPSVIEAALLAPLVGPGRAAELLLFGESIGADEALAWGLVNRVVARDELDAAVDTFVQKILASAPAAIRLQKELMIRWRSTDLATAVEYGVNAFAVSYASPDATEGLRAFLEKRAPRW
jgi:crotonobetainyl-CoA hydratase